MSFSIDLWDGFDRIKTAFSLYPRSINYIMDILSSYSLLQKGYLEGLENLFKKTMEIKEISSPNNFLNEIINLLMFSFLEESQKCKDNNDNITHNINEIKKSLEEIKMKATTYFTENIQNKEKFNKILNNLISKQEIYNNSCNELCLLLAENEIEIIEKKISNNKNINKKKELIEKALNDKNEYLYFIEEGDKERAKYNKKTEDLLNNLQKEFKNMIFLFENCLHNYVQDKIKYYEFLIDIYKENDKSNYSKLNYKKHTQNFIAANATKIFPMNQLEFFPYKINKNEIFQNFSKNNELSKEDQNKIFNEINKSLTNNKININENEFINIISQNEKINYKLSIYKRKETDAIKRDNLIKYNYIFINDFVFKLCNSTEVKLENDKNKKENEIDLPKNDNVYNNLLLRFMELISKNNKDYIEYLNIFVKVLTYYRSKGYFILNDNSYQVLINIFSYILINYQTLNNIIKNIILFSQTFYKIGNSSKNKIYLLNGLKNHDTFNDITTWHRAINYNLSLLIKKNNYCLDNVNKEEYLNNLNKIVVNSIISYLYDIKLSTNDNNVYENIKNFYVHIYKLDKKMIEDQVSVLFGEFEKKEKEKEKEKNGVKIEEKNEMKIEEKNEMKIEEKDEMKIEEKNEMKIEEKNEVKIEEKNEVKIEEKNEIIDDNKNKQKMMVEELKRILGKK